MTRLAIAATLSVLICITSGVAAADTLILEIEHVKYADPPERLASQIQEIEERAEAETDDDRRQRLLGQLERLREQAERTAVMHVFGIGRDDAGDYFAATVDLERRYSAVRNQAGEGSFIRFDDANLDKTYSTELVKVVGFQRIAIAERPNDWVQRHDDIVRQWEEPVESLTKQSGLKVLEKFKYLEHIPRRAQRSRTAVGTVTTGHSGGGYRVTVPIRNDRTENIEIARIVLEYRSSAGEVLSRHYTVITNLAPEQEIEITSRMGRTLDRTARIDIGVCYLNPVTSSSSD